MIVNRSSMSLTRSIESKEQAIVSGLAFSRTQSKPLLLVEPLGAFSPLGLPSPDPTSPVIMEEKSFLSQYGIILLFAVVFYFFYAGR